MIAASLAGVALGGCAGDSSDGRRTPPAAAPAIAPASADRTATARGDSLLKNHYRDPRPEHGDELLALIDAGLLGPAGTARDGAIGAASGWYSVLFERYPDRVGAWLDGARSPAAGTVLLQALLLSGRTEQALALVRRLRADGIQSALHQPALFGRATPAFGAMTPANGIELDRLWGASFASGDPLYLRPLTQLIAETVGRDGVTAATLMAVASRDPAAYGPAFAALPNNGARVRSVVAGTAVGGLIANRSEHGFVVGALTEAACGGRGAEASALFAALLPGSSTGVRPACSDARAT